MKKKQTRMEQRVNYLGFDLEYIDPNQFAITIRSERIAIGTLTELEFWVSGLEHERFNK